MSRRSRPNLPRDVSGRSPHQEERFGAGIVAGVSDNDPTTVATLAVIGSTTTYELGWLTLAIIPMLAVIQAIAAQVGTVSKKGLEDCVRYRYGRGWAMLALAAMLVVNILTLAADLEGGGAALHLVTGVDYRWWLLPLGGLTVVDAGLRQLPLDRARAALPGAAVLDLRRGGVHGPPGLGRGAARLVRAALRLQARRPSPGALALLGTTLTAYAYVWETIELSEEKPRLRRLGLVQVDAALGIVVAGLTFWFILIATGATLGVHHLKVETAQQAAQALAPVAGRYASLVFAVGLLGSALVAIPVIAGTSAFVAAEMFGWRHSLDASFDRARRFYLTLGGCVLVAVAIGFAGVPPIKLLFFSGIAGGIATPFTIVLMLLVARDRKVMRQARIHPALAVAGWGVALVVSAATGTYLVQTLAGSGS